MVEGSLSDTQYDPVSPEETDMHTLASSDGPAGAPTDEEPQAIFKRRQKFMAELKIKLKSQNREQARATSIIVKSDQLLEYFKNRGYVDAQEVRRVAADSGIDALPVRDGFVFAIKEGPAGI